MTLGQWLSSTKARNSIRPQSESRYPVVFDHAKFAQQAMAQHKGGEANYKGVTYQIFASVVWFLRFASRACQGKVDDLLLSAENEGSRVDDLHAVSDHGLRWHFQMKAVESLSLETELLNQFEQEFHRYPGVKLYLVVHSNERAEALERGRSRLGIDYFEIDWIDFTRPELAFQTRYIRDLLDVLSAGPNDEVSYHAGWKNLLASFFMSRGGRLSELLKNASIGSKYTIRSLHKLPVELVDSLKEMETGMDGLAIKVKGGVVVISDSVISTFVPVSDVEKNGSTKFWDETPGHPWGLYEAIGSFREIDNATVAS